MSTVGERSHPDQNMPGRKSRTEIPILHLSPCITQMYTQIGIGKLKQEEYIAMHWRSQSSAILAFTTLLAPSRWSILKTHKILPWKLETVSNQRKILHNYRSPGSQILVVTHLPRSVYTIYSDVTVSPMLCREKKYFRPMRILSIDGHYEMELIEFGWDIFLLSTAQRRASPIRLFFRCDSIF